MLVGDWRYDWRMLTLPQTGQPELRSLLHRSARVWATRADWAGSSSDQAWQQPVVAGRQDSVRWRSNGPIHWALRRRLYYRRHRDWSCHCQLFLWPRGGLHWWVLAGVWFQWRNPDLLFKKTDLLIRNLDFILKECWFYNKTGTIARLSKWLSTACGMRRFPIKNNDFALTKMTITY